MRLKIGFGWGLVWLVGAGGCAADGDETNAGSAATMASTGGDGGADGTTQLDGSDTDTGTAGTDDAVDSESSGDEDSSGDSTTGVAAPEGCQRQACHYDCFDEAECTETMHPWACDLPSLCGQIVMGEDFEAEVFAEAAQCLLAALRDGTVGQVRFSRTSIDGELGELGPFGTIHILPDRQVVVDLSSLDYCDIGMGINYEQRSMVMDLVPADHPAFETCLGQASTPMLETCLGFDGAINDPSAFPWVTGTCTDVLEHDGCP